jgi:hypothetical protein
LTAANRASELVQLSGIPRHPIKALTLEQLAFLDWVMDVIPVEVFAPAPGPQPSPASGPARFSIARQHAEQALRIRREILNNPDEMSAHSSLALPHLLLGWMEISMGDYSESDNKPVVQRESQCFGKAAEHLRAASRHLTGHPLAAEAQLGCLVSEVGYTYRNQKYPVDQGPNHHLNPPYVRSDVVGMKAGYLKRLGHARTRDWFLQLSFILDVHGRPYEADWLNGLAESITIESKPEVVVQPAQPAFQRVPCRTLLQRLRSWRLRNRR